MRKAPLLSVFLTRSYSMVKFTRKLRGHFAIYLLKSACMQLQAFLDITVHLDVLSLPCKEIS